MEFQHLLYWNEKIVVVAAVRDWRNVVVAVNGHKEEQHNAVGEMDDYVYYDENVVVEHAIF